MPTPLLQALYRDENERVQEMLKSSPQLNIFEAAAVGDVARVRELIEKDPSLLDAAADDGFHPTHLAAYFGKPEVVRLLLMRGADPNAVASNASRVRPLHSAIAAQQLDIMEQLLAAGADPDAQQASGWTALHSAAEHGNIDAIRLLLTYGASPEIAAEDGRRPADMAREPAREDVAQMLRLKPGR